MEIISKTKSYYIENKKKFGEGSPLNLWAHSSRQLVRFEQFVKIFNLNEKIVLDVGCGYGDFYLWLTEQSFFPKTYTGIDLIKEHCDVARQKLPSKCRVVQGDFLVETVEEADISILSGTLNYYEDGWMELATRVLDKMWDISREAIAFNIPSPHGLSGDYPKKSKQLEEMSPSYWCSYAHNRTNKYLLFHDYANFDFTVAMWKP